MRMKPVKRFLAFGLAAALTVTSVFVTDLSASAASSKKVKSITLKIGAKKVTKKTYSLAKGKKATIKVTVNPSKAKKSVAFKTSSKKIAAVTKKGVVTAKAAGTAKITVTVKGKDNKQKAAWVKIKVTAKAQENPAPEETETPAPTAPVPTPSTPTPPPEYNNTPVDFTVEANPIAMKDQNGNPLYGGDPSILVDGDTVYLYVGHDVATNEAYNIPEYCCYSTKDLKNWTYHGVVLNMKDVTWGANDAAWAGQVMKYNNKYYLYYCSWDSTDSGKQSIGVAVADKPTGPFADKGTPLVKGSVTTNETSGWNDIDPTAWIETDDQGVEHRYLSWGNGKVFVCELNEDMVSVKDLNGDGQITFGTQAGGKTSKDVDIIEKDVSGLTFTEAPWIYRRQDANGKYYGKYYLFYAFGWREQMAYATTDNLLDGKLEFESILMPPSATSNTNHMAVFDFNGKTYFVYHNGMLPAGSGFRRTPCITEVHFNEDGSIQAIPETAAGIHGTVSTIYSAAGDIISHEKFDNSSADGDYPYTKIGAGIYENPDKADTEWVITEGKADTENKDYVSIQSENKPGLYLTANDDKTVTVAQDHDIKAIAETAKKQTFKKSAGLADEKGVSFESVSQPGYYLTLMAGKLYLTDGSKKAAATFFLNEKPASPVTDGSLSKDNELVNITVKDAEVKKDDKGNYTVTVPYTNDSVTAVLELKDTKGVATVGGALAGSDGSITVALSGTTTTLDIVVYAEDLVTAKKYTITITKDFKDFKFSGKLLKSFDFENQADGATAVIKAAKPAPKTDAVLAYADGVNGGKAIKLDGTYGLQLCDGKDLGESYSISFWMNPDKLGGGVDPTLAAGVFDPQYWLNLTFDAKIWSNNGGYVDTTPANAYTAGKWQNVVLTVDGTVNGTGNNTVHGKLYVDGKLVCEGDVAKGIMTQANSVVYFGVNAWDAYFSGSLDEVMLFEGALSAGDIQAISSGMVTAKNAK